MSKRVAPTSLGGKDTAMLTYCSMRKSLLIKRNRKLITNRIRLLLLLYHFKISHQLPILTSLSMTWMQIYTIAFGLRMKPLWNLKYSMIRNISSLSEITFILISSYNHRKKAHRRISAKSNHSQEYPNEWNYSVNNTRLKWLILMRTQKSINLLLRSYPKITSQSSFRSWRKVNNLTYLKSKN